MHFTLWPSLRATSGSHAEIVWESFLSFVAEPMIAAEKEALSGWSPIRATGDRRGSAHVERVSALVLDDDASGLSTEQIASVYEGVAGAVHTSFSHTPDHPKHRIVLRTSRDMTPDEHARVWRVVTDAARRRGQSLDEATKDSSRFWYAPGRREGAPYDWRELSGVPLDVDAILSSAKDVGGSNPPRASTAGDGRASQGNGVGSQPQRPEQDQPEEPALIPRRAAMAAALGAAWPAQGRHQAQLALAGALRAEGWPAADALEFLCAVCRHAGSEDRPKREATIRHTYGKAEGAPLTGWTRLKELVDPLVVDAVRGALGRDAEWNEATTRKLAEAARMAATSSPVPSSAPSPIEGDTVSVGPFVFKVGGLDAPLPPLVWAIDGLINKGDVAMLVAHGNSLKTWLAFSMALSTATGRLWLGQFATLRGRAALLDFESGDYEVTRRLKLLGAKDDEVRDRLLRSSYSGVSLTKPETWIELAGVGLDLLVIDSFNAASLVASADVEENDARAALMLQHAGRFANATGCTVIVIHHARKGSGGDDREAVRGSTALYAACDRVFKFDDIEKKDGGLVVATMRSIKDGAGRSPPPVSVELSDQGLRFVEKVAEPEEVPMPEKNRALVLSILSQHSAGVAKEHLVNLMVGKREKKFELLSQLTLSGATVEYPNGKKVFIMLKPGA